MNPLLRVSIVISATLATLIAGCSSASRTEDDAAAFFQSQCGTCTDVVARVTEDEVAASTFEVRYRDSVRVDRDATVVFVRDSATWSVVR